jgi:hypothetical protein
LFFIVILASRPVTAQDPFFYDGTRALSLGRAFTGLVDDENSLFYNPAGLARFDGGRVSLSGYIQQYSWQSSAQILGGIQPNFTDRGLNVSYVQNRFGLSYSTTGKGWWDEVSMGSWSESGFTTEKVRPVNYEHFLTGSYAHELSSRISIGLTCKYLHYSYHSDADLFDDKDAAALDLGLLLLPCDKLSVGINLMNAASSKIDYLIYNDFRAIAFLSELPVNLTVGINYIPIKSVTITADARHLTEDDAANDNSDVLLEFKRSWHIGLEWRPVKGLSIRAGYFRCERPVQRSYPAVPFDASGSDHYEYNKYNNLTIGAGYAYRRFSIDLCIKNDDRESQVDKSQTTLRDSTLMGAGSISYSF